MNGTGEVRFITHPNCRTSNTRQLTLRLFVRDLCEPSKQGLPRNELLGYGDAHVVVCCLVLGNLDKQQRSGYPHDTAGSARGKTCALPSAKEAAGIIFVCV